jgi:hypothetical protein
MFFYAAHGLYTEMVNSMATNETFDNVEINNNVQLNLYSILINLDQTLKISQKLAFLFLQIFVILQISQDSQLSDKKSIDFIEKISKVLINSNLINDLDKLSKVILINLYDYYNHSDDIRVIMTKIRDLYIKNNNNNTVLYNNITHEITGIVFNLYSNHDISLVLNLFSLQIISFALLNENITLSAIKIINDDPNKLLDINAMFDPPIPINTGINQIIGICKP